MKKLRITLLALAIGALPALARQLSPAEALAALSADPARSAMMKAPASSLKLAHIVGSDSFNSCYIFNRGDNAGFLVVAADDAVQPLLGYSDEGAFDPADIPANMKEFLEGYAAEIRWASEHPDRVKARKVSPERDPIEPICTTKWSQEEPFNLMCPVMDGSRAVVGCVATAMAQVMKVHNWPPKGVGSNSYKMTYNGQSYNISSDFSSHTYDWGNMLDTYPYTNSGSTAERDAIAQLMYDCGVSVYMGYSPYASGANGSDASMALVQNFNYDKGLQQLYRTSYYLNEWNDLAYSELKAGRPTLICGANSEGGHAFVCDGYSSDDYFHINWGWRGLSDGYFLLSILDPEQQGTGGSSDGYSSYQRMAIGIQPPVAGSETVVNIINEGGFATGASTYERSSDVTFTANGGGFWNFTLSTGNLTGTLGVKLVNTSTSEATYICQDDINFQTSNGRGYRYYVVPGSKFPTSGSYIVTPAFKTSAGKWVDIRPDITMSSPMHCEASATTLTFSYPEAGSVEITEFEVLSETYIGYPITYRWKLANSTPEMMGEISTALCSRIASGYRVISEGQSQYYDILKGETIEETWSTMFDGTLSARDYYFVFFLDDEAIASYTVTLKENPGELAYGTPTFVSLDPEGEVPFGRRSRPAEISPNHSLKASLELTSGYFGDMVTLDLYHYSGRLVASSDPVLWSGVGGETMTITANPAIFAGLSPDVLYYAVVQPANGTKIPGTISINSSIWFKLTEASGVEDVAIDTDSDTPAVYFDLQGRKVENPAGGLYIVRRGSKVTKEYVK